MEVPWVDQNWHRIRPHIARLCETQSWHGMTVDSIARSIQGGRYRVWVWGDFDAIFLTSIFAQNTGRLVCSLSWAAGNDAIHPAEIYPAIQAHAKLNGCSQVQIMGRMGWLRVMKPYGFALADQTIVKEI